MELHDVSKDESTAHRAVEVRQTTDHHSPVVPSSRCGLERPSLVVGVASKTPAPRGVSFRSLTHPHEPDRGITYIIASDAVPFNARRGCERSRLRRGLRAGGPRRADAPVLPHRAATAE